MSSSIDTVQYIVDQAGLGSRLTCKKMFGEYALYLGAKLVALICDNQLFLKPTPEGRTYLGAVSEAPPYPGAKKFYVLSSEIDDPDRLREALKVTAAALPEPKPKAARTATQKAATTPSQARVREACLALPDVVERGSWGHPNFCVGKRAFVTLERFEGEPSVALRLSSADVKKHLQLPGFFATPYGRGQWVSLLIEGRVNWRRLLALVKDAHALAHTHRSKTRTR